MKFVVSQLTFILAATSCLVTVGASPVAAQCNRGGSGGGTSGAASRLAAQTSLGPTISYTASLQALAYQRQLAQQQYLLAQQRQQRYLHALAMQRARLERQSQLAQEEHTNKEAQASDVATSSTSQQMTRRQRQLETNAKRLYRQAIAAEANRNYGEATVNYRRIVRMLSNDSELAKRAQTSLAKLDHQQQQVAGLVSNLAR